MKSLKQKFLAAAAVSFLALFIGAIAPSDVVHAGDYNVDVGTYNPSGVEHNAADFTLFGYPQITGAKSIRSIHINNVSASTHTLTMWDNCTSSTAVRTAFKKYVANAASWDSAEAFPANQFMVTSPCFTMDPPTTGVNATIIYQ